MASKSESRFLVFVCAAILIMTMAGYYWLALFLALIVLSVLGIRDFVEKT